MIITSNMRTLIQFLINNAFFFLFLLLEVVCFSFITNFNEFQRSVFLSSGNRLTGTLYQISNSTTEYFSLKEKNDRLSAENARLLNRILFLESQLEIKERIQTDTSTLVPEKNFYYFPAKIINNTTNRVRNYITINKGTKDGVKPDMGVICDQGIVGIINAVSDHFSVAISVLNPKIKISCKLKKNNYAGSLAWNGDDYRYAKLEDISSHVPLNIGDSIITTGYSSFFPENIPVGTIKAFTKHEETGYYDIDVELLTDFKIISNVKIINYQYKEEQSNLENSVQEQ